MSSRELLELAAKAVGLSLYIEPWSPGCQFDEKRKLYSDMRGSVEWNPLTDDGDSRRLQAALRISLEFGELPFKGRYARAKVTVPCTDGSGHVWEHDAIEYALTPNDMERAARYAVLHVAAAIGKEMP